MQSLFVDPLFQVTTGSPIDAHLAMLRHLARPPALAQALFANHSYPMAKATKHAQTVAPYIQQGLAFLESAKRCAPSTQPLPRYYGYLNLAVAVVLIYQPANWQKHHSHGSKDLSRQLGRISLSAGVVAVETTGVIPLFHSVLCAGSLPTAPITLRNLFSSVNLLAGELGQSFGVVTHTLEVGHRISLHKDSFHSHFELTVPSQEGIEARFPSKRLGVAAPFLKKDYAMIEQRGGHRQYRSRRSWTKENLAAAEEYHYSTCLQLLNFGAQAITQTRGGTFNMATVDVHHRWSFTTSDPLLPALTASLLLSHAHSSISRYRPNLLGKIDSSRINLLFDSFALEADGLMVPAFRNLLSGETVHLTRQEFL